MRIVGVGIVLGEVLASLGFNYETINNLLGPFLSSFPVSCPPCPPFFARRLLWRCKLAATLVHCLVVIDISPEADI